ncbi:hypothetical protein [Arthrobacter sp. lap29]|uniref:hypothetical protein n=1 Tax=Arthrobacter sp. lap29 TaxID=3056122 RepID=UPI0028F7312F|nr:hypothetical protein [Arthrobacter sp. lap29]
MISDPRIEAAARAYAELKSGWGHTAIWETHTDQAKVILAAADAVDPHRQPDQLAETLIFDQLQRLTTPEDRASKVQMLEMVLAAGMTTQQAKVFSKMAMSGRVRNQDMLELQESGIDVRLYNQSLVQREETSSDTTTEWGVQGTEVQGIEAAPSELDARAAVAYLTEAGDVASLVARQITSWEPAS